MRVLNKKQKKMIDKWFDENWTGAGSIGSAEDLPLDLYEELERINDHETIHQNLTRYINDKACEKMYG